MRVWGRVYSVPATDPPTWTWIEVTTDPNGFNDMVYLTALIQELKLGLGESPFYGSYGIPGAQSVITQVAPDYYVMLTQQRYAPYFASLVITKRPNTVTNLKQSPVPTYDVSVITHQGVRLVANTAIPT